MKNQSLIFILILGLAASCVSKKQLASVKAKCDTQQKMANTEIAKLKSEIDRLRGLNSDQKDELIVTKSALESQQSKAQTLEKQVDYLASTNKNLLDRLSDLSVVSKAGAESIKKSLEAINGQNKYIQDLTQGIQRRDSINLALVTNLKRSLNNVNDDDINIEVKKGVVYISLSDKLLFRSGSSKLSQEAEGVLGKIATVVNDHSDLDILVEGHTDNIPISTECISDNWDLSVKRATSIVRLLQEKYEVKPSRMTAGGRSSFVPKATNDNKEGRALNRRSEIIILPKLDQFFKLLETPSK